MYAVSGVMQGTLLVMCIAWTYRQNRLGIDDFGRSIHPPPAEVDSSTEEVHTRYDPRSDSGAHRDAGEHTPLLAAPHKRHFGQSVTQRLRHFFTHPQ